MDAFTDHDAVLENPAPSVTFKDLTTAGLIIGVSGYVNSPRSVSGTRSDLLFILLARLQDMGITLSSPQSMVLIPGEAGAVAGDVPVRQS